jgi:hypothetical protein
MYVNAHGDALFVIHSQQVHSYVIYSIRAKFKKLLIHTYILSF